MLFTAVFVIYLIAYSFFCWKSTKLEERNIYNLVTSICILLNLMTHIGCLQYSIWKDHNGDYPTWSLQNYINFQFTFDLMNIAVLSQLFQWIDLSNTLIYII